jgi:hypothetical protein
MALGLEITHARFAPAMPTQQTHFFHPNFSVTLLWVFYPKQLAASSTKTAAISLQLKIALLGVL